MESNLQPFNFSQSNTEIIDQQIANLNTEITSDLVKVSQQKQLLNKLEKQRSEISQKAYQYTTAAFHPESKRNMLKIEEEKEVQNDIQKRENRIEELKERLKQIEIEKEKLIK